MRQRCLDIVILGGSFAGLTVAHYFLGHLKHRLSNFKGAPAYRVVLISPSTHLFWNIYAPRALVSPNLIRPEDAFLPIEPAFAQYSSDEFVFIQGCATGVDTSARQVTYTLVQNKARKRGKKKEEPNKLCRNHSLTAQSIKYPTTTTTTTKNRNTEPLFNTTHQKSKIETIPYHALIIATGSSTPSPLYSLHGPHEETLQEIKAFHSKVECATSVLIVGGGLTGVETAAQIARYYNQSWRGRKRKRREGNVQASEVVVDAVTISKDTRAKTR